MGVHSPATYLLLCCWAVSYVTPAETQDSSLYEYYGSMVSVLYEPGFDLIPSSCEEDDKETRLLVVVHSEYSHRDARDAARLTWGTFGAARNVSIVFLLGRPRNDSSVEDVLDEARLYGDVLLSRNIDTFDNFSLKAVAMAEWASRHCAGVKYILKIDDDVFLNFPRLLQLLEMEHVKTASRTMFGRLISNNRPIRDEASKFHVPITIFPGETYPPYLQGGAFLFTGDLLKDIYLSAFEASFFKVQDLFFTAFLGRMVRANLVDVNNFFVEKWWSNREWSDRAFVCDLKTKTAVHPATYETTFDMWYMTFNKEAKC